MPDELGTLIEGFAGLAIGGPAAGRRAAAKGVAAEVGQHFEQAGTAEFVRPHQRVLDRAAPSRTILETAIAQVPLSRTGGQDQISRSLLLRRILAAVFNKEVVPKIGLSPDVKLYMRLRVVVKTLLQV